MCYRRTFPDERAGTESLFTRMSPGAYQYLRQVRAAFAAAPPPDIVTDYNAKSCTCPIFATARLPCDHLIEAVLDHGGDPLCLLYDRWDMASSLPAPPVTAEPAHEDVINVRLGHRSILIAVVFRNRSHFG